MLGAGCERVIVCATHYINFDTGSGGDNVSGAAVQTPTGDAATLITAQQAARTAMAADYPGRVAFCDLYGWFYALLVANPSWIDDQSIWHYVPSTPAANVHLNPYGQSQVAAALLATVQAQDGWLDALSD
jgi:hypothetical protein